MMWNWLVSALSLGTTLVLYDGSPLHPHPSVMWDLVDECGITVFGTSAKWIAVQEDKGIRPLRTHNLSTLRHACGLYFWTAAPGSGPALSTAITRHFTDILKGGKKVSFFGDGILA